MNESTSSKWLASLGLLSLPMPALADDYTPLLVIFWAIFLPPLIGMLIFSVKRPRLAFDIARGFCVLMVPLTIVMVINSFHPMFYLVPWFFGILACSTAASGNKESLAQGGEAGTDGDEAR